MRKPWMLEAGAPLRMVWFHHCDRCDRVGAGPAAWQQDLPLDTLREQGWRCNLYRPPWDTCPACLTKEETDSLAAAAGGEEEAP